MRRVLVSLLILAVLAAPAHAAKERDFAVGAKQVLAHEPRLPSDTQTGKSLKQILARPEFKDDQQQPQGPSLLDRLLKWISQHLGGLGAGLADAGTTTLVIACIVVGAFLVLLIYVVVRALWSRMSRLPEDDVALAEETLTASGFRELARKAAGSGDYLPALRYRFRAVVGELDVLDPDRQTNWQLLRHVRRQHADATSSFAELIALFEDCWYGGRAATADEYTRAEQLAAAIEKALIPREAAA